MQNSIFPAILTSVTKVILAQIIDTSEKPVLIRDIACKYTYGISASYFNELLNIKINRFGADVDDIFRHY